MSTPTYTLLSQITLAANTSAVTFSSLPQNYKDLVLIADCNTGANVDALLFYNLDTTQSNYHFVFQAGNGSSASTSHFNGANWSFVGTSRGAFITHIVDYSAIDKHKISLTRTSVPTNTVRSYAHRWANTAAITSVRLDGSGQSFQTGSTFSLYGIVG